MITDSCDIRIACSIADVLLERDVRRSLRLCQAAAIRVAKEVSSGVTEPAAAALIVETSGTPTREELCKIRLRLVGVPVLVYVPVRHRTSLILTRRTRD